MPTSQPTRQFPFSLSVLFSPISAPKTKYVERDERKKKKKQTQNHSISNLQRKNQWKRETFSKQFNTID